MHTSTATQEWATFDLFTNCEEDTVSVFCVHVSVPLTVHTRDFGFFIRAYTLGLKILKRARVRGSSSIMQDQILNNLSMLDHLYDAVDLSQRVATIHLNRRMNGGEGGGVVINGTFSVSNKIDSID